MSSFTTHGSQQTSSVGFHSCRTVNRYNLRSTRVLMRVRSADLYGSLDVAQPPYFGKLLVAELPLEGSFSSQGFRRIVDKFDLDKTLCTCVYYFESAMAFWSGNGNSNINGNSSLGSQGVISAPAEAARARHLLTRIQYTLLSTELQQRCVTSSADGIREFCRITLILYSLSILNEHPPTSSAGGQIVRLFRHALAQVVQITDKPTDSPNCQIWRSVLPADFLLWSLFLAISVIKDKTSEIRRSFLSFLTELIFVDNTSIRCFGELHACLREFLWVPCLHDPLAQDLWDQIQGMKRQ
jgi:hypothetical protein